MVDGRVNRSPGALGPKPARVPSFPLQTRHGRVAAVGGVRENFAYPNSNAERPMSERRRLSLWALEVGSDAVVIALVCNASAETFGQES